MKRIRLATAAIAILLVPHLSQAGQITYLIQNYAADQNGSTLSGSVTTDGNLGTLTSADIVAWTWTVTPPVGRRSPYRDREPTSLFKISSPQTSSFYFQNSRLKTPSSHFLARTPTWSTVETFYTTGYPIDTLAALVLSISGSQPTPEWEEPTRG